MPNHVTQKVTVTGPVASLALLRACFTEQNTLDFERIIPMPEVLNGIPAPSDTAHDIYRFRQYGVVSNNLRRYLSYPWLAEAKVTTIDGVVDLLIQRDEETRASWKAERERREAAGEPVSEFLLDDLKRPPLLELGERVDRAIKETGYGDWYEWCINTWGTKWNAYRGDIDLDTPEELRFTFNTAWGIPTNIYAQLGELFPDLEFAGAWFDEGWCHAGRFTISEGVFTPSEIDPSDTDPESLALYEEVYGEPPEFDEDEEGDEE